MTKSTNRPIVLVDMDGVLFDWSSGFYRALNEIAQDRGIKHNLPPASELRAFDFTKAVPEDDNHTLDLVWEAMRHPELYTSLEPIPGAVEALNTMGEEFDTYICSTPEKNNPTCASDKIAAMTEHFGDQWRKRIILTHDKTLVHGDVLIDDKDFITGRLAGRTSWQQVFFTQPYNAARPGPRIDTWDTWRDVVVPLLDERAA